MSFHFGLLCLHLLSCQFFVALSPFILAFCRAAILCFVRSSRLGLVPFRVLSPFLSLFRVLVSPLLFAFCLLFSPFPSLFRVLVSPLFFQFRVLSRLCAAFAFAVCISRAVLAFPLFVSCGLAFGDFSVRFASLVFPVSLPFCLFWILCVPFASMFVVWVVV